MSRRIRIRHPAGTSTVEIPAGSTAGEAAHLIGSLSDKVPSPEDQVWKEGYPPKKLDALKAGDPFPADASMLVVSAGGDGGGTVDFRDENLGDGTVGEGNETTASDMAAAYFPGTTDPPARTGSDGFIVRRVVDADNACLFNSVGYVLRRSRCDSAILRRMIARAVLDDPSTYNAAFLEKGPAEYAAWIERPESWGGQIELHIFSTLFRVEIAAFDVARDRYDVYGSGQGYGCRCMMLYDGIHYDAIGYTLDPRLPEEADMTIFSPDDDAAMGKAKYLCREQHGKKEFTDTSSFTLRCMVCQQGLKGAEEAQRHAQKTGHANFSEFR